MKKNNVYVLEDRGLLYLNGEDVKEYLQNLITNDIEKVTDEMSCFAALLTPQGKYLFDFLIVKVSNKPSDLISMLSRLDLMGSKLYIAPSFLIFVMPLAVETIISPLSSKYMPLTALLAIPFKYELFSNDIPSYMEIPLLVPTQISPLGDFTIVLILLDGNPLSTS